MTALSNLYEKIVDLGLTVQTTGFACRIAKVYWDNLPNRLPITDIVKSYDASWSIGVSAASAALSTMYDSQLFSGQIFPELGTVCLVIPDLDDAYSESHPQSAEDKFFKVALPRAVERGIGRGLAMRLLRCGGQPTREDFVEVANILERATKTKDPAAYIGACIRTRRARDPQIDLEDLIKDPSDDARPGHW